MKQKRIHIFENVKKMQEDAEKYNRAQNPLERIRETVEIILRIYPPVKIPHGPQRIFFDNE